MKDGKDRRRAAARGGGGSRFADDPAAKLAEIKARLEQVRSPFRTAEKFGVEAIIDPRTTRSELCRFANMAQRALKPGVKGRGLRP
jgi:propionyl-CoA carboxylase beta chain